MLGQRRGHVVTPYDAAKSISYSFDLLLVKQEAKGTVANGVKSVPDAAGGAGAGAGTGAGKKPKSAKEATADAMFEVTKAAGSPEIVLL